jgi:hypothetical protein
MRRPIETRSQNAILQVRLFADELESVKQAAERENMTVSDYVRSQLLNSEPERASSSEKAQSATEKVSSKPVLGEITDDSQSETEKTQPRAKSKRIQEKRSKYNVPPPSERKRARNKVADGKCRHGFMVIDGMTSCSECRS